MPHFFSLGKDFDWAVLAGAPNRCLKKLAKLGKVVRHFR
jgi:hypothetical protein